MKEMIKRVREDKGGFTLAELLIVVAIIMVLVAIAIPVFSSSMDSANASTDEANIRSGYAQAQIATMTGDVNGADIVTGTPYYLDKNASLTTTEADGYVTKGTDTKLTGKPDYLPAWSAGKKIAYTFEKAADGKIAVTVIAK